MKDLSDIEAFIGNLSEMLDSSLKGAVISDMRKEDQPVIYCNQTFLDMTGYKKEEILGRNCRFLQDNDREQPGLFILRSAISAHQPCKIILKNYSKTGELFFNRLSVSPLFSKNGRLTHYVGFQDDVTDIISISEALERTEKENEVLLAEVHHRVKNNLSIMSSLLTLEKNEKSEQDALEKSRLRIHSMALIHEKLYQKEGLAYIDISDFIKELANRKYFASRGAEVNLSFDFDLQKVELNINQAIPFSIIVSEFYHNILTHAYPNQADGKVKVKLRKKEKGKRLEFEIMDFGVGLTEGVNFYHPDTLGLTVIQTLLSQIGADAEIIKQNGIGFGVRIKLLRSDKSGTSQNMKIND